MSNVESTLTPDERETIERHVEWLGNSLEAVLVRRCLSESAESTDHVECIRGLIDLQRMLERPMPRTTEEWLAFSRSGVQ